MKASFGDLILCWLGKKQKALAATLCAYDFLEPPSVTLL